MVKNECMSLKDAGIPSCQAKERRSPNLDALGCLKMPMEMVGLKNAPLLLKASLFPTAFCHGKEEFLLPARRTFGTSRIPPAMGARMCGAWCSPVLAPRAAVNNCVSPVLLSDPMAGCMSPVGSPMPASPARCTQSVSRSCPSGRTADFILKHLFMNRWLEWANSANVLMQPATGSSPAIATPSCMWSLPPDCCNKTLIIPLATRSRTSCPSPRRCIP